MSGIDGFYVIAFNAGSVTLSLLESELYGNPANYPNPGMLARKGLFPSADRGTLFLDEIGELPYETQVQLLRALQEGQYTPVGESIPKRADVIVVGATNRDDSCFKEDFHDRFKGRVRVPPLRERREDIPLLIRHLMQARAARFPDEGKRLMRKGVDGRLEPVIDGRLVDYLVRHPLAGNVRELDRLLMICVQQSPGDEIRMPASMPPASLLPEPAQPLGAKLEGSPGSVPAGTRSKAEVEAMLDREAGNVARAAKAFNMNRTAFYRLMWSLGLKKGKSGGK